MTETTEVTTDAAGDKPAKKRGGGLNTMLLADLKSMAAGMGIPGAGSMKKAQLVEAIKAAQNTAQGGGRPATRQAEPKPEQRSEEKAAPQTERQPEQKTEQRDQQERRDQQRDQQRDRQAARDRGQQSQAKGDQPKGDQPKGGQGKNEQPKSDQGKNDQRDQVDQAKGNRGQQQPDQGDGEGDGDGDGSRRNRRRRGRDRTSRTGQRNEPDTTILEDDILVPAAGILDVLDNYAFVRTSGYLAGADDVYVSLSMVRKYGLRRGDALVGQVRQPREGERKEKFNPMVRIDAVNGADPEAAKHRPDFAKLTPVHPAERLRLETGSDNLIGRSIDLVAPIGKGQRGLIASPSNAGKTTLLQSIAGSITTNNPECHLMVVLVDERPEEVTDFERSVKGEVISSTFDRPASDHTTVAELAIERAKRLVELGHDVVVLLDGITRLGRAYNLSTPASGRILSGGVDAAALYPAKRFFGAARNIEDGGSLTILATASVESDSAMDQVIFEELKDTGNLEIRLRRELADRRLFPAIDVNGSGTRREELLIGGEELAIVERLRRQLSALDADRALEQLLDRLGASQTNIEFLMQIQRTTPTVSE